MNQFSRRPAPRPLRTIRRESSMRGRRQNVTPSTVRTARPTVNVAATPRSKGFRFSKSKPLATFLRFRERERRRMFKAGLAGFMRVFRNHRSYSRNRNDRRWHQRSRQGSATQAIWCWRVAESEGDRRRSTSGWYNSCSRSPLVRSPRHRETRLEDQALHSY